MFVDKAHTLVACIKQNNSPILNVRWVFYLSCLIKRIVAHWPLSDLPARFKSLPDRLQSCHQLFILINLFTQHRNKPSTTLTPHKQYRQSIVIFANTFIYFLLLSIRFISSIISI